MITGYNHNIKHCGRVYHIQTEDSGTKYPHIITHLFVGGNIFASKKRSYAHLLEENLDEVALEKAVRAMMQEQHKDMLRELKSGKYDEIEPGYSSSDELDGVSKQRVVGFHIAASTDSLPASEEPQAPAPRAPLFIPHLDEEPQPQALQPEEPEASEPATPSPRAGARRGEGRLGRRRASRARPAFQTPPPRPSENASVSAPADVSAAVETIELGSSPSLDSLFADDETPTIPDLPEPPTGVSGRTPLPLDAATESGRGAGEGGGFSPRGLGRARSIRGRGARPPRPTESPKPPSPLAGAPKPPGGEREPSSQASAGEAEDSENNHAGLTSRPQHMTPPPQSASPSAGPSLLNAWLDVPEHAKSAPNTESPAGHAAKVRVVVRPDKKEPV